MCGRVENWETTLAMLVAAAGATYEVCLPTSYLDSCLGSGTVVSV